MRQPEDVSAQQAAVASAREALAEALHELRCSAHDASRAARSAKGQPDLDDVSRCYGAVTRAGEALDLAVYDLQTASGADG